MKKFASLFLALTMLCSLSVSAFAAHTTTVTYTGTSTESYTLTVPASLTPGASGEVKASGTWASNRTLVVTAPDTVTLTNDIDGGTKTLDVTFDGINQAGNDTVSQTVSKDVTVGNISNALFGTWSGVITYNVSMENNVAPTLFSFTINYTLYQAEEGMTWAEWVDSEYNVDGYKTGVVGQDFGTSGSFDFSYDSGDLNVIAEADSDYGNSHIVGKHIMLQNIQYTTPVSQSEVITAMDYIVRVCCD